MEKSMNIFIIDNDKDDINLMVQAIKNFDNAIECAYDTSGWAALKTLRANVLYMPDIIILDLNMPEMNGIDFLILIKKDERLKTIPVVMFTTSNWESDVKKSLDSGASYFFTKPMSFNSLKVIVGSVVRTLTE